MRFRCASPLGKDDALYELPCNNHQAVKPRLVQLLPALRNYPAIVSREPPVTDNALSKPPIPEQDQLHRSLILSTRPLVHGYGLTMTPVKLGFS
jgi:hypothetical protein